VGCETFVYLITNAHGRWERSSESRYFSYARTVGGNFDKQQPDGFIQKI